MVRDDHDRIDLSEELLREARGCQLKMVFSETGGPDKGVVVTDGGSLFLKERDDGKSGRLSRIIHILLVRDA